MTSLKGILVAISVATLVIGVWVFAAITSAHVSTSRGIEGTRPSSGYSSSIEWFTDTGIIGNVSIGPIRPVCFVGNGTGPVPYPNDSDAVVVTSQFGERISIPANWSVWGGCELWGSFKAGLGTGKYSLNLFWCSQRPRSSWWLGSPLVQMWTIPTTVCVGTRKMKPLLI